MGFADDIIIRRRVDARRFKELDNNKCMLCGAVGQDMRSFIVSALYNLAEVIDEMIDLNEVEGDLKGRGWYLRTCKTCRGKLLTALGETADSCRENRKFKVGSDGEVITMKVKLSRETGEYVEEINETKD